MLWNITDTNLTGIKEDIINAVEKLSGNGVEDGTNSLFINDINLGVINWINYGKVI